MTDGKYSKPISDFLAFLRAAESLFPCLQDELLSKDKETQDILHTLELERHNARDMVKLAKVMREVRQERRTIKDQYFAFEPIAIWVSENKQTVKALERLLGEERKLEARLENRVYVPRSNIVEKTLKGES